MSIFKKKVNFIAAICPKCNGHLELDSKMETAFCQYCGTQCVVENAPKKKKKHGKLEMVLDFFERQQNLRRQDKQEQQRRLEEEQRKHKEEVKRYWWVYVLVLIGIFGFLMIMSILENHSII